MTFLGKAGRMAIATIVLFLDLCAPAVAVASDRPAPAAHADNDVIFFPAPGKGRHSSIVLLHGYRCIDDCMPSFARYAQALNRQNVDVYFLRYYSDSDNDALHAGTLDQGEAYATRFKLWTRKVDGLVQDIRLRGRSNRRIGLIGFSQGGRLAIASAANNPAIGALVVFYARLPRPDELNDRIRALPPTLVLHGSEDTVVPLTDGEAVYAEAKRLGAAPRAMFVYSGQGHGFDFVRDSEAAADARRHAMEFVREQLP